jgi:hypothetical protein
MMWFDVPYFLVFLAHMWTGGAFCMVKKFVCHISKYLIFAIIGLLDSW